MQKPMNSSRKSLGKGQQELKEVKLLLLANLKGNRESARRVWGDRDDRLASLPASLRRLQVQIWHWSISYGCGLVDSPSNLLKCMRRRGVDPIPELLLRFEAAHMQRHKDRKQSQQEKLDSITAQRIRENLKRSNKESFKSGKATKYNQQSSLPV